MKTKTRDKDFPDVTITLERTVRQRKLTRTRGIYYLDLKRLVNPGVTLWNIVQEMALEIEEETSNG